MLYPGNPLRSDRKEMTKHGGGVAAFNRSLRVRLILWTGVILAVVVTGLTTFIARNAMSLLETQTAAQLTQLTGQSARAVSDFIEARERTVELWAVDSLMLSVARDPGLRAVFLPGLAGYLGSYAQREPWISDILLVENRVPIFSLSGRDHVLENPMALVTLTDTGSPGQRLVRVVGEDRAHLAIRRQASDRGKLLEGVFVILLVDPEIIQSEILASASPSSSGFVALQSDRGKSLVDLPVALGHLPVPVTDIDTIANSDFLIERHVVPNSPVYVMGVASRSDIEAPVRGFIYISAVLGLAAIIVGLGGTLYFTGRVTAPIRKLTDDARAMANLRFGGKSQTQLPSDQPNQDEVSELAAVFDLLDRTTEELTETNGLLETRNADLDDARRSLRTNLDRLELEMDAAKRLQLSMVAPDRKLRKLTPTVQAIGLMEPAREVGGDFYDSFSLDEKTVVFFIGDVSDKGTASALLMSRTVSLVRFAAQQFVDLKERVPEPDEILARVNTELCKNNSTRMFVTLYLGILNTRTGTVSYCNAGHASPILSSTKDVRQVSHEVPDLPLGVKANALYETKQTQLAAGDRFVMYTDGVTEAEDIHHKFFGVERLLDVISTARHKEMGSMISQVREHLSLFVGEAVQFDDITLLIIGWEPMG